MPSEEQSQKNTDNSVRADGGTSGNSVGGSCPDCGGPTTEKGITVTGGPWADSGRTWDSCLNCEWNSKGDES